MAYAIYMVKPGTNDLDYDMVHQVWKTALGKGLYTLDTPVGVLKLAPPLSIPEEALLEGINILDEAICDCT